MVEKKQLSFISKDAEIGYYKFLAKQREKAELLKNCYIKNLLCMNTNLSFSDIPTELVLLKRENLRIKRLLWRKKNEKYKRSKRRVG